jgi:uncharacterized protein (UPF0332 family)
MSENFDDQTRLAYTTYRIEQAENSLADASLLLTNDRLNAAANRMYYACFYATEALLIQNGIKASTHTGVRQMFGLHYVQKGIVDARWGRFLTRAEQMCEGADYDSFIQYDKQELQSFYNQAAQFVTLIKTLLNLSI